MMLVMKCGDGDDVTPKNEAPEFGNQGVGSASEKVNLKNRNESNHVCKPFCRRYGV